MKSKDSARTLVYAVPNGLRTAPDLPQRQSLMQHRIESKRHLLTKEMLLYIGETCPALAERCETIVELPPRDRREAAKWLQTLCSVSNETNRELAAARLAASKGHATINLLDRALASIEHLRRIAETVRQRIDELTENVTREATSRKVQSSRK
jgi:acyl-CoA reductase-like NAD-dependent aldehyde dehydrogenase